MDNIDIIILYFSFFYSFLKKKKKSSCGGTRLKLLKKFGFKTPPILYLIMTLDYDFVLVLHLLIESNLYDLFLISETKTLFTCQTLIDHN